MFTQTCKFIAFFFMLFLASSLSLANTIPKSHKKPSRMFGMFQGNNSVWQMPKPANPNTQTWSGFCPHCTLDSKEKCAARPCQKRNIEMDNTYKGIQISSDHWARLANRAARYSVEHGGGPFGAVILQIDDKSGRVIRYWVGHNQVVEDKDPTAHAEISTIRMTSRSLGVINLGHINRKDSKLPQPSKWSHCIIYSSAEPCPMCYSATYWAGIKTLIFAATRYDAAVKGVNFSDAEIYESLKKHYAKRRHTYRHAITNNSLGAFNYYKRTPVKRYGEAST